MTPTVRQIIGTDHNYTDIIAKWMHEWWGENDGISYAAMQAHVDHTFQEKGIPQTYGLFLDEELLGVYQFVKDEIYLITQHIGLYEKYGWEFMYEIDSHMGEESMERLYRLRLV